MCTKNRLAICRRKAAESKNEFFKDWRNNRYALNMRGWKKSAPGFNWSEDRQKIYADSLDMLGEYQGDWCDFSGGSRSLRDTNGFYADNWCNETIKGGVERIRTAKGTLYVPVTYCTGWDGVTYYMKDAEHVTKGATESDHETAKHEAANSAFHYAEREADQAREDAAKDSAADQIADARIEIHHINKQTRALLAEIRAAGTFSPAICDALRDKVRDLLADRKKCFKTIAEREEDFWSSVPAW